MATVLQVRTKQSRTEQKPVQHPQTTSTRAVPVPEVTPDTEITQVQSLEIVQTLLLSSLSTLCYIRALLPTACFEDREYESVVNERLLGNAKASGILASSPNSSVGGEKGKPRHLKILDRGRTPTVDKIYKWLDAIFDALRKKNLRAVQLAIHPDKINRQNVLEAYNFTFEYRDGISSAERDFAGISISRYQGAKITIKNARKGLDHLLRNLIVLTESLPYLPEKRYLSVYLFYFGDCPGSYVPEGFIANTELDMQVPDEDSWKMTETKLGSMDSGFHRVSVQASAVQPAIEVEVEGDATDVQIPSNISFDRTMERIKSSPSPVLKELASTTESAIIKRQDAPSEADIRAKVHTQVSDAADAKAMDGNVVIVRDAAQDGMMRTLSSCAQQRWRSSQDQVEGLRSQTIPDSQAASQEVLEQSETWALTSMKDSMLYFERERRNREKDQCSMESVELVQCACGSTDHEGVMIQCDCCDTWQHQHCYGLQGQSLGPAHVCYPCLLGTQEAVLLNKMQGVALQRRAVWIIQQTPDTPTDAKLGEILGCGAAKAKTIIRALLRQKIVMSPRHGRRPRQLKVNNGQVRANVRQRGFLSPLAFIQHHACRTYRAKPADATDAAGSPTIAPTVRSVSEARTDELLPLGPSQSSGEAEADRRSAAGPSGSPGKRPAPDEPQTPQPRKSLRSDVVRTPLSVHEEWQD